GEHDGRPFLVMEYVQGSSLKAHLGGGSLPVREVVHCLTKVALGLEHLHRQGIVHRDLKPSNILLQEGIGEPKIADFALAKVLPDNGSVTTTGQIVGSVPYMAPELIDGQYGGVSPSSDIFSLGVLMYEALTARTPFRREGSILETLHQVRS